jgi:hypothetical protein
VAGGQLTIVLHGMWAVVWTSECLELIAPVGPDLSQSYISPGTNVSVALPAGIHQLIGVEHSGPVRFPRQSSLLVENLRVINRAPNAVHCSIYLPHPVGLEPKRRVKVKAETFFAGSHGKRIATKRVSLVYVLTHNYGGSALLLGDIQLAGAGGTGHYTLHLSCEPNAAAVGGNPPLGAGYTCGVFERFGRIFPGLDLRLMQAPWVKADNLEVCSLWERAQAGNPFVPPPERTNPVPLIVENV